VFTFTYTYGKLLQSPTVWLVIGLSWNLIKLRRIPIFIYFYLTILFDFHVRVLVLAVSWNFVVKHFKWRRKWLLHVGDNVKKLSKILTDLIQNFRQQFRDFSIKDSSDSKTWVLKPTSFASALKPPFRHWAFDCVHLVIWLRILGEHIAEIFLNCLSFSTNNIRTVNNQNQVSNALRGGLVQNWVLIASRTFHGCAVFSFANNS